MGKKANFHANFLDLTTIENKITGFCECNKVYVSIYSSFKSFIKCFIVQTTKILSQIIDSIKFCPQISGSKWENIYPWEREVQHKHKHNIERSNVSPSPDRAWSDEGDATLFTNLDQFLRNYINS